MLWNRNQVLIIQKHHWSFKVMKADKSKAIWYHIDIQVTF